MGRLPGCSEHRIVPLPQEVTYLSTKPTYLGLLNAITLNETRAYHYLQGWIATTPDPDVREVLCTVAAREGEHGLSSPSASTNSDSKCERKTIKASRSESLLHRHPISPTSTSSRDIG